VQAAVACKAARRPGSRMKDGDEVRLSLAGRPTALYSSEETWRSFLLEVEELRQPRNAITRGFQLAA
jgi:PHD/YefM family antitoxin component YafN of YafNO toxin-antitoxin module